MILRSTHPFIRIGDRFINVANIAYVEFLPASKYSEDTVRICFAAMSQEQYMETSWHGDDARAINEQLRGHLNIASVVQIDLPAKEIAEAENHSIKWTDFHEPELKRPLLADDTDLPF